MKAATTRKDVSMNYTDPDGPDPDEGGVPEPKPKPNDKK